MKLNNQDSTRERTLSRVCRKAMMQIVRVKEAVLAEWSQSLGAQQHAVRLALNEAEALAWQTTYPHLVLPVLATEKIQAVAAWNTRQRRLLVEQPYWETLKGR